MFKKTCYSTLCLAMLMAALLHPTSVSAHELTAPENVQAEADDLVKITF